MTLRLATPHDGAAVAAIYAPVVRDTAVSFEAVPPDAAEMASRIAATLPRYPYLVAEREGLVVGYAYAGAHRTRAAYAWCAETSVYLAPDAQGQGLGRSLMEALLGVLAAQGVATAVAGATLPNDASVALHRALGFRDVGVFPRAGFKNGQWWDTWWGARDLGPGCAPAPPLAVPAVDDLVRLLARRTEP